MLINLRTIHKPTNLALAAELLREPGVYPLYGGGAYLLRTNAAAAESGVVLGKLIGAETGYEGDDLHLSSTTTLAALADLESPLAPYLRADYPATLRNALTLGDLLMEAPTCSLTLAALYGFGARVNTPARGEEDRIEMARWFNLTLEERRTRIVLGVVIPDLRQTRWRTASAKVARTPADTPIVAAIAFAYAGAPDPGAFVVVCGLDDRPQRYTDGMSSRIDDHNGSAAYRVAVARVLSAQALAEARAAADQAFA